MGREKEKLSRDEVADDGFLLYSWRNSRQRRRIAKSGSRGRAWAETF